ncbi:MAG: hypothetical protein IPM54_10420 [Polyangiaceae bacterium]|nr:hypothetical protein [Polyangiaceae bacterium]
MSALCSPWEGIVDDKRGFSLGEVVQTRGSRDVFTREEVLGCLLRHANGDWGDLEEEDKRANELALKDDERLVSAYKFDDGRKMYIITEWDRSYTTVLLPEEY